MQGRERCWPPATPPLRRMRAANRIGGRLTPCTTRLWLTVSGNRTAWATSHGTPEASSCDSQKAGLPGLPQLTADRLEGASGEEVGKVALNAYSSGRRRANLRGANTASTHTSSCCAVVAAAA